MNTASHLRVVVLLAALLLAESAMAMWAKLSEQELFESSDLIVVGTLTAADRANPAGASIRVGQVLKGAASASVTLAVPAADRPISSSDIVYRAGQTGLWYLRSQPTAGGGVLYLADHPQRFVPIERAQPQIEALRKARKP